MHLATQHTHTTDSLLLLILRERTPMPITRRKRANPPDQPEDNNHIAEQNEQVAESLTPEQAVTDSASVVEEEQTSTVEPSAPVTPTPVPEETVAEPFAPISQIGRAHV